MKRNLLSSAARAVALGVVAGAGIFGFSLGAQAQTPPPTLVDPTLAVSTVVSGLSQPIAMAFIGPNDILVTEKASGQVKRVTNGAVAGVVLDLAVNFNSERGLLGIALHPRFPRAPYVYLYYTESATGADTNVVAEVPLLGNRVDRFAWDGSKLTFERNIIKLRALQNDLNNVLDPANPVALQRGNHDGGVLRFGPDRKLYIIIGDVGRRGFMQNNRLGPVPDDAFGGPEPDNAHLSGVILRLNDDGSTPRDNPFYKLGKRGDRDDDDDDDDDDDADKDKRVRRAIAALGDEARANIQRIFGYGVRNSFGMTFDPKRGDLWTAENGGRAFDEINRVRPGFNGGWVQIMGPVSRVAEYRDIEIRAGVNAANGSPAGLQQARFPATRIATTPEEAISRTFHLPGSRLTDPQFSWKYVVPPAALGFIKGDGLGDKYDGDLIVGSAVARAANPGHLYRFRLNHRRTAFVFEDLRLQDKVADNLAVDDLTESDEIIFGRNFGVVTHIETGADGALYLVSPAGTIRKITKN